MGDQERFEVGCKVAGWILTAEWLLLAVGVIFFRGSLATMLCALQHRSRKASRCAHCAICGQESSTPRRPSHAPPTPGPPAR